MTLFEFILIFIILVFIILVYVRRIRPKNEKIAIHSVFIAKENILFLQEWIDYHIFLGVDYFFLYDNSKAQNKSEWDSANSHQLKHGKVNKIGIKYHDNITLSCQEINSILEELKHTYKGKVFFIEWSPRDENGKVLYNQIEAITNCIQNLKKNKKADWLAVIDIDEYLVCPDFNIKNHLKTVPKDVSNLILKQVKFESRFFNLDKKVIDIQDFIPKHPYWESKKNLCRISKTKEVTIHNWFGTGKQIEQDDVFFCHYNSNEKSVEKKRVIPEHISNKIKLNKYSHPDWKKSNYSHSPQISMDPELSRFPELSRLAESPIHTIQPTQPEHPKPTEQAQSQVPIQFVKPVQSQYPQAYPELVFPTFESSPPLQLPFQQAPTFEPNPNLEIINQINSQQPQHPPKLLFQEPPTYEANPNLHVVQQAPTFEPNPNLEIINQINSQQPQHPPKLHFQQAPTYEANPNLHVVRQPIQITKDLHYCENPMPQQ